jgi:hypothetical protein
MFYPIEYLGDARNARQLFANGPLSSGGLLSPDSNGGHPDGPSSAVGESDLLGQRWPDDIAKETKDSVELRNCHAYIRTVMDPTHPKRYRENPAELLRLLREAKVTYPGCVHCCLFCMALQTGAVEFIYSSPEVACELYDEYVDAVGDDKCDSVDAGMHANFGEVLFKLGRIEKSRAAWRLAARAYADFDAFPAARGCICGKIAVSLARGDLEAAQDDFRAEMQEGYFEWSEESVMIDRIIRGLENDDAALLESGQNEWVVDDLRPEIRGILLSLRTLTPPVRVEEHHIWSGELTPMKMIWVTEGVKTGSPLWAGLSRDGDLDSNGEEIQSNSVEYLQ